jgi:hypothetical protein
MSPSFIALILLRPENKSQTFLLKSTFQIVEITSMLDKCSPVIVVEPATTIKRKCTKMVPVVEAEELLQINSFVMQSKPKTKSTEKYPKKLRWTG